MEPQTYDKAKISGHDGESSGNISKTCVNVSGIRFTIDLEQANCVQRLVQWLCICHPGYN